MAARNHSSVPRGWSWRGLCGGEGWVPGVHGDTRVTECPFLMSSAWQSPGLLLHWLVLEAADGAESRQVLSFSPSCCGCCPLPLRPRPASFKPASLGPIAVSAWASPSPCRVEEGHVDDHGHAQPASQPRLLLLGGPTSSSSSALTSAAVQHRNPARPCPFFSPLLLQAAKTALRPLPS